MMWTLITFNYSIFWSRKCHFSVRFHWFQTLRSLSLTFHLPKCDNHPSHMIPRLLPPLEPVRIFHIKLTKPADFLLLLLQSEANLGEDMSMSPHVGPVLNLIHCSCYQLNLGDVFRTHREDWIVSARCCAKKKIFKKDSESITLTKLIF